MILEKIAACARARVERRMAEKPLETIRQEALRAPRENPFAFERALVGGDIAMICEVKKASPSKGVIAETFPYVEIAREYERAGAAAISVLTEPEFFLGADRYLTEIKAAVNIPVLRKDFIVDAYQLYEAKCIGADAVLLICALLDTDTLRAYLRVADELGLSCLVEAHDAAEIESAVRAGARVIGVNNRDLRDFTVDMNNSVRLRSLAPETVSFVSESGIKSAADIDILRRANVRAALIGETLMKSTDKTAALAALYGKAKQTKVKICGLTRMQDVEAVNRIEPDYAGFVFAESRRKVSARKAKELKLALSSAIRAVGVFVNERPEDIASLCGAHVIDIAQLHGDESEDDVRKVKALTGKPVIRAVRVKGTDDIERWQRSEADFLLLDAYSPGLYGGTGKAFDWSVINQINRPFFLAGGVGMRNAAAAIHRLRPYALDISGGVETDGVKDARKIEEIIGRIRSM